MGPRQLKCGCKHDAEVHDPRRRSCLRCQCKRFHSSFRCPCGAKHDEHRLVVETKIERQAAGKPVGRDVPFIGMGGLTGFSSNLPGPQRLDASGIGDMYRALEN